ncbi:ABC transporter ATP-binding protein [Nodosilinea sp. LEGE 07088]|uniref:ABC transporter ATP-binding protein n=1 Tax=Nodosilinea sp. LEGE 07088 TaxID=2777968 RepID=UPI001881008F|nr:ABC transporter ATP-binding protein [Nodosilinea sp. LEGE 07088]MBE9136370.1 ABC transporter ATP-binding protein [Nodosilinea sp. LEGE 07088]
MLKLENLCKRYGSKSVLQNLSLALQPGEIYGLLGPNGAGKTTTINIICGLLKADSGTVIIGNQVASAATKAWVGVMPQGNLLYGSLTCSDNLFFFGRLYGLTRQDCRRRVEVCLEAVNLLDQKHTPVERLSGGMQRRLSMAASILHRPKLVILDEPTTGLDIEARQELWQLIRQFKAMGVTVLLTSHLLDEVERLCQRIGILRQGQLLAEGTLAELRSQIPAKEIVTLETSDPQGAIARGQQLGYTHRRYGGDLAFWVPEQLELKDLISQFEGIPLDSIARHPVRLEHIYLEVTRPTEAIQTPMADGLKL